MDPKDAEIARLKGLVGRYAKHLAFNAYRRHDEAPHVTQAKAIGLDKFSPWLTWEEINEIKSYI